MESIKEHIKRPNWIKVKAPNSQIFSSTYDIIKNSNVNTVCVEANCPNISECWSQKHVTFMILGSVCTRSCRFCNVKTGKPKELNLNEPQLIAQAVKNLELKHVVITSVNRDDLADGGAKHFADCISKIRDNNLLTTIEVLTPDFLKKEGAIEIVMKATPDVYNHNVETVPSLYKKVRPGARYYNSLKLLDKAKQLSSDTFTKSGIMLGIGENIDEVIQVMDDLRSAQVDFLTIGQYLQPTLSHIPVQRYVTPEEFDYLKRIAKTKGFLMVASSPLTRSSYHAYDDFQMLKQIKQKHCTI